MSTCFALEPRSVLSQAIDVASSSRLTFETPVAVGQGRREVDLWSIVIHRESCFFLFLCLCSFGRLCVSASQTKANRFRGTRIRTGYITHALSRQLAVGDGDAFTRVIFDKPKSHLKSTQDSAWHCSR
jgi:hypothetical protein